MRVTQKIDFYFTFWSIYVTVHENKVKSSNFKSNAKFLLENKFLTSFIITSIYFENVLLNFFILFLQTTISHMLAEQ